jgi:DNA polymerase III sliding clamp (beta) subunit (PCNA family)
VFELQNLARALSSTLPAACKDETRAHLTGVVIKRIPAGTTMPRHSLTTDHDRFVAVATDGHRLFLAEVPTVGEADPAGIPEIRIPIATVKAVIKLARDRRKVPGIVVSVDIDGNGRAGVLRLTDGSALPFTPTVGAEDFPPFAKVIPAHRPDTGSRFGVNAAYMAEACEAAALYGDGKGGVIVEPGSNPLDPVCVFASTPQGHFVSVTMPMRVD